MSEDAAISPVSEGAASGAASPAVDEDGAPAAKGPKTMGEIFRQLLLERCQFEFEHDRVEALEAIRNAEDLSPEGKAEKEQNLKKRYTGTMRFIGELFVKDLIRANIMTSCLEILLQSTEEEELTCMSKLFVTIGAQLDNYYFEKARATKTKSKRAKYLEAVPQYFVKVEELALNHPSSRVRYMLKDLIDLRANAWIPRRETDKVVDLSESRGISHSNSSSNVEGLKGSNDARNVSAAPAVSDEWTTVTSVKGKTASSNNLTQLNTSNLGTRSGPNSGNKFVASKGGNSGLARSVSHSNVNSAAASGPSPKNGPSGWDKKKSSSVAGQGLSINPSAGGKSGSRPPVSPMPQTTSVSGGVAAVKSMATVAETPAAATASAVSGPFDKESASWKRIKSTVEEYYSHKLVEEVTHVLSELSVPASHMPEIIKYLIIGSLEKKAEDRSALAKLIIALSSSADGKTAILTKTGVTAGVLLFLSEYDDVVIDVPLAGAYGAGIVGELIAADILSLLLFVDLPEDNNFAISTRAADFILQTLAAIAAVSSAENAKTLFAASGIQLLPLINAPPRQSKEDALAELVTKFNVSLIV